MKQKYINLLIEMLNKKTGTALHGLNLVIILDVFFYST